MTVSCRSPGGSPGVSPASKECGPKGLEARRGGAPKGGAAKGGGQNLEKVGAPKGGAPKGV